MRLQITKYYNRQEHSYLAVLDVSASAGEDAAVFVVMDLPPAAEASSESSTSSSSGVSSESSSSGVSSESSSSGVSSESSSPESSTSDSSVSSSSAIWVYPTRVLVAVASLTDLMVYGTIIPSIGELYRAATVALLFRSEDHMNRTLQMIQDYVAINAELQRAEIEPTEIIELYDPGHGLDLSRIYLFR